MNNVGNSIANRISNHRYRRFEPNLDQGFIVELHKDKDRRVLFVDQTSAMGGAEISLFDILRQRSFRDRVILFQHGKFENILLENKVDVSVCELTRKASQLNKSSGFIASIKVAFSMVKQVLTVRSKSIDCDCLYANTQKAFVVCAFVAITTWKPLIYHLRDIISEEHFSSFNRNVIIWLAKLSNPVIIANSKATADAFRDAGGRVDSLRIIHNGIDESLFQSAKKESNLVRSKVRNQLGITNEFVVGVFGRFAEWKGQQVAIEALSSLPDVHLLLVGDALFGEETFVESLRKLVAQKSLEKRVHFLGFRDDVPEVMQACDVIAHCSIAPEPFGRNLVEGMLSRRPVVASKNGGVGEIITDGETGLFYTPNSSNELAECILRLQSGEIDIEAMTTKAYEIARVRFNLADRVDEINQTIENVCLRRSISA